MQLTVRRHQGVEDTPGELLVDGAHFCWTLEDPVREVAGEPVERWKVPNETAIPVGRYTVAIDWSPHFNRAMLHVLDVPGFSGVRIHNGRTKENTEGCLLVNYQRDRAHPDWLADFNRQAMLDLEVKVAAALHAREPVTIEYFNPEAAASELAA